MTGRLRVLAAVVAGVICGWGGYWLGHLAGWSADADWPVQMQVLTRSIGLWETDRVGYSDPQAWENMHDLLLNMKLLAKPLDVSKAFTNEFVP